MNVYVKHEGKSWLDSVNTIKKVFHSRHQRRESFFFRQCNRKRIFLKLMNFTAGSGGGGAGVTASRELQVHENVMF